MSDVAIIGIGIHPFGRTEGMTGLQQGVHAAREALSDAEMEWGDIQFAFGGSSAAGNADAMVNDLGLTGIPFMNVSNGCATGGSSLLSAYTTIKSGQFDIGMAVGFDKHPRGAFNADPEASGLERWYGETGLMLTTQFFGMKIQRYMHDYGITSDSLAIVAEKAFNNASLNPNAWRRDPVSKDTILNAMMVSDPLTKYMFCSPGEGAVALIMCRADIAHKYTSKPLFLKGAAFRSRPLGSFEVFSPSLEIERGPSPTVGASEATFEMAGMTREDIDIAQLQDTESGAEIMHMAENGFCKDGDQEKLLQDGDTKLNGKLPVNTDGGCIANGEPVGASGLRQVYENCVQLRGAAGKRQVQGNPKTAYTHVYGAPGISACTIVTT
ncbi:thiolase family protein [Hyphomicrobiales bacterium]|nr:thiolase family protein [Hyphomicrobiales bacterium]MDC3320831.1 thiolase family protein [Hyphomicrobiales bacterium]|tara:strand:+ start:1250 stop:2395 length:1146 start_codon:yes stop_codon:yes gene_type:complete